MSPNDPPAYDPPVPTEYPIPSTRERPEILTYFTFEHLPRELASVSARFADLAEWCARELPPGAELSTALRKLLEGKDAAVRAALKLSKSSP